jgi:adenosylcobinamide kinase / adenosylcobinamide-phosphate guanylyltransferase
VRKILVLGGARSGKSAYAERLATEFGAPVVYVATASAGDAEMAERIAHHRARRPPAWRTVEATTDLASVLATHVGTIVVEDLTLLLSNHMERDSATAEPLTVEELETLWELNVNLILVSNEVGMGIVPEYPLGRHFRDALGRLNQHVARKCDEVYFILAGLPLRLK